MAYVITCGDEGIQINEGTRLGILGAGYGLAGFGDVAKLLQKTLKTDLRIVANAENGWIKQQMNLATFEEADASMQQQVEALADQHGLLYSGFIPFADPKELKYGIKGHMVRPQGVHIANKISFTLGGGEQTFHLGHYQISADWVGLANQKLVKEFIEPQIEFYQQQAGMNLAIVFETEGELDEKTVAANQAMLESVGITQTA